MICLYTKMNPRKMLTTNVENNKDDTIQIRQCNEQTQEVGKIYNMLKHQARPLL